MLDSLGEIVEQARRGRKKRRVSDLPKGSVATQEPVVGPGKGAREHVIRLIRFAIEHGFVVTPVGYGYFVDSFNKFNACPCDRTRNACPCDQAASEVLENGHCLCHLFWRNYEIFLEAKNMKEGDKQQKWTSISIQPSGPAPSSSF